MGLRQAFDDDQRALELATNFSEDAIQRGSIAVRETAPRAAGKFDAFKHAVVDEAVVDDQVFRAEEIADGADVGGVTADEDDAVFHVV